ncbi:hypothetical protein [Moorena sp. SIO4G3]|nr:hypothetical protein [Moorena sp. SIO4G3]
MRCTPIPSTPAPFHAHSPDNLFQRMKQPCLLPTPYSLLPTP